MSSTTTGEAMTRLLDAIAAGELDDDGEAPSFEDLVAYGFGAIASDEAERVPLAFEPTNEPYPDDAVGIYLGTWPAIDGGSVTLATYGVADAASLSDSTLGIQVTVRHPERARTMRIADDLFDTFHGRPAGMLGVVRLVSCRRASATTLGQDTNGRYGRSENYYLEVPRPSPHRT